MKRRLSSPGLKAPPAQDHPLLVIAVAQAALGRRPLHKQSGRQSYLVAKETLRRRSPRSTVSVTRVIDAISPKSRMTVGMPSRS